MGDIFEEVKWQRWNLQQLKGEQLKLHGIEGECEGLQGGKENVKLAFFLSEIQVERYLIE